MQALRTQLAKTGDTIYDVVSVEVDQDTVRFVPISLLNELRREAVARLDGMRLQTFPRRERRSEHREVRFPAEVLTGEENVVNSLAERFYREHGVTRIEPGYDLRRDFRDLSVMRMRYCLRREMGTCLKEHPAYKGKLYLRHEQHLYELQFDCARCMMTVVYRGISPGSDPVAEKAATPVAGHGGAGVRIVPVAPSAVQVPGTRRMRRTGKKKDKKR